LYATHFFAFIDMIKNLKLMMAVAVFALAIGNARAEDFHGGPLTAEEKALKRKGDVMEVYQPSDHSG